MNDRNSVSVKRLPQSAATLSNALDLMGSSLFSIPARLIQGTSPLSKSIRDLLDEPVPHALSKSSRPDGRLESVSDIPFGSIAAHCYVRAEKVNNVKGEQLNYAIPE